MSAYSGKNVIITGAAQGIGKALAQGYAQQGAHVIAVDHQESVLNAVVNELLTQGLSAKSYACDLSQANDIKSLLQTLEASYDAIHGLINNAGLGVWKDPLELDIDEWDYVLNTNLRGTFLMSRGVVPLMKAAGGGAIVNMASTRAIMSEPNSEAYAASKGGILSLTHALAVSLGAYGITVNAISPGWIETGDYEALRDIDHAQHPAGLVGKPSDIVRTCMYFTDFTNKFVTGTNIFVDGGMTRKMFYEE